MAQRRFRSGHTRPDTADEPASIARADLLELAAEVHSGSRRCLVGLTGPPGSGKSYLAAQLARSLRPSPPVVPMDGFHLAQAVIDAKGLANRKGAPETFDAESFVTLLTRIANPASGTVVYAPVFDRSIEEPISEAIPISPADVLVIVEGNYLLLGDSPWAEIRLTLDLCVYLEIDDATRVRRLVDRHLRYGKPRPEAERFVRNSDEKNAQLIKATRSRADFIIRMDL